jgi:tetratricopeptide (TPR) repeat protein
LGLRKYEHSIHDLTRAIEINPKSVSYYDSLSVALYHTGDFDNALRNIEKGLELNRNYPQLYSARGALNLHKAKQAKAECNPSVLEDMTKAIALDKTQYAYINYTSRAKYYLYVGNYENAYADLKIALDIHNGNGMAWYLLSQYHKAKGETKKQDHCLAKSKECNFIPDEVYDTFI